MSKARIYADENIENYLIDHLRSQGVTVLSAQELGFVPRSDEFHLQEARRRKCILFSHDTDFLNNKRFPYQNHRDTAIVVFRTDLDNKEALNIGYALVALLDHIVSSGKHNLGGLKIEIRGPKIIFHGIHDGKVKKDEIDISKPIKERMLFE